MTTRADPLDPVDVAASLARVQLTLGQVCVAAGITKMQLDYWTQRAGIPTHGRKQRTYDLDALETVLLIKQAKDRGLSLSAAIEAVAGHRAARAGGLVATG